MSLLFLINERRISNNIISISAFCVIEKVWSLLQAGQTCFVLQLNKSDDLNFINQQIRPGKGCVFV